MSADASGILDTRNTIRTPNFDGSDANWESWRAKFETYAGLAKRTLLQNSKSFIRHDGLDDNSLLTIKTDSCPAHHESARAKLCLWSRWLLDVMALKHGECSRKSTRAKVEIAHQRS